MEEKNYCLRCDVEITKENFCDFEWSTEDGMYCDDCAGHCEMLAESLR